jgi:hypothetical protein
MARYTDIDNLIKIIQDQIIDTNPNDLGYKVLTQFIAALNHAPIADVAPRAEVEYWKEQCFHACMNNGCLDKAIVDAAVARELFEEIEGSIAVHAFTSKSEDYADGMYDAIEWVDSKIAELKKKYTEGQK